MTENEISEKIIGCAIRVHKKLGAGLLESAYAACLHFELINLGLKVEREKSIPLMYENIRLECGYRLDLIIEDKVIIEVKSIEALDDIHLAQILTYLRLTNCKLGLLLNFNVLQLKNGIKRVVNNL
jgi:GxxExxY protein